MKPRDGQDRNAGVAPGLPQLRIVRDRARIVRRQTSCCSCSRTHSRKARKDLCAKALSCIGAPTVTFHGETSGRRDPDPSRWQSPLANGRCSVGAAASVLGVAAAVIPTAASVTDLSSAPAGRVRALGYRRTQDCGIEKFAGGSGDLLLICYPLNGIETCSASFVMVDIVFRTRSLATFTLSERYEGGAPYHPKALTSTHNDFGNRLVAPPGRKPVVIRSRKTSISMNSPGTPKRALGERILTLLPGLEK